MSVERIGWRAQLEFNLPTRKNAKLQSVLRNVRANKRLETYWKCCNINVVDRLHMNDHGPVHIKIISNIGLKILRMLFEAGVTPAIVKDHKMDAKDAEVVVFLGCCLHDIGLIVSRKNHADYSVPIALSLLPSLLGDVYGEEENAVVTAETLHAVRAHETDMTPLTVEAGVVRFADALDMVGGRARIPFQAGLITIHSVSAMAIDKVEIKKGKKDKPIVVEIGLANSAGIFQIDELLKNKLKGSTIEDYVHVVARIEAGPEKKIIEKFEM